MKSFTYTFKSIENPLHSCEIVSFAKRAYTHLSVSKMERENENESSYMV